MTLCNYSFEDGVGTICLDDGKVNAMNRSMISAVNEALDQAEADKAITILAGRPGIFSAGFDLNELMGEADVMVELLRSGSALCQRLLLFPYPVIVGCTGHAYPMGAFVMLASDYRLGISGSFKIGMNEVNIGIAAPYFAMELAKFRLNSAYFNRTAVLGEMFSPEDAKLAGFLDETVMEDRLVNRLNEVAEGLKSIDMASHRKSKYKIRSDLVQRMKHLTESEITVEEFNRQNAKQ